MSNESENEEIDVKWKHGKSDAASRPAMTSDLNMVVAYSIQLKNWELKMIIAALCGRLQNEEDILVAKHLGLTIRRRMAGQHMYSQEHLGRMIEECDESLQELHQSEEMEHLRLKKWMEHREQQASN